MEKRHELGIIIWDKYTRRQFTIYEPLRMWCRSLGVSFSEMREKRHDRYLMIGVEG